MGCHTWFYKSKEHLLNGEDCEFHDVFRTTFLDEDTILTSLEETLEYMKKYNCKTSEEIEDSLKAFWYKYPKGIIDFG